MGVGHKFIDYGIKVTGKRLSLLFKVSSTGSSEYFFLSCIEQLGSHSWEVGPR